MRAALAGERDLVTTDHVLVETWLLIHGRSGGTLKATVHARLVRLPAVSRFRLDPRNPGVTIVEF